MPTVNGEAYAGTMDSKSSLRHMKKTPRVEHSTNGRQGHKTRVRQEIPARRELEDFRKSLPIFPARQEILDKVQQNDNVIIVGETGSGKSTQIPQYLMESQDTSDGMIAITQPRRVAAMSLAKRVAEEAGCVLGNEVGYTIRFDDTSSPKTRIKYLTDGMLIRELLSDALLSQYSVVILDEAHERSLRTDILFGMVKDVQKKRREDPDAISLGPLKIIVMSATLDAEKFSDYFDSAPILYVSGRMYPVKVYNTVEPQSDYIDAALVTIFQIHREQPPGDILVFLTGQEEIESMERLLNEYIPYLPSHALTLQVCPIFAALPTAQQQKVFQPPPPNTRKVILATNIAETSITIPGIRYVIDCGVAKMRGYNSKIGIESLLVHPISKSSARQRLGRAGREAPGCCFRLYTEDAFAELREDTVPEIKRCNLSSAMLLLKASGVKDVVNFDYMDKPSRTSIIVALEELFALQAIDNTGELSEMGERMALFPLIPHYAKSLLQSQKPEYACSRETIDIISLLTVDTLFFAPSDKREASFEARRKFTSPEGDHLTLLNVLNAYLEVKGDKEWCRQNFINMRNMNHVMDVRKQLIQFCERYDIDPTISCGLETDRVLRCFLCGFFQNTALLQPDGTYKSVVGSQTVHIHPSSAMFNRKAEAIMYNELVFTTKQYIRGVSAIQAAWIVPTAPHYFGAGASKSE